MEGKSEERKRSGGRPKKQVKRDQLLGVKCTLLERTTIEQKARSLALTVSDFLRTLALTRTGDPAPKKVLSKELLQRIGMLNHIAANINQIARRHNRGDALSLMDRQWLFGLESEIKEISYNLSIHYS